VIRLFDEVPMKRFAIWWGAAALLFASAASAATVLRLEPGALAEQSALIFIGTVAQQDARLQVEPRQVFTDTVFAVDEVLKGKLADGNPRAGESKTFTLTQLGGAVEGYGTQVPGYARFSVGERVMLFVERADTGRLVVTGLAQGKYTLSDDPKTGVTIAQRGLGGLHQIGNAPDKVFANVPENANRMTLGQLLNIVVAQQPPRAGRGAFNPPKLIRHQTRQLSVPEGAK
jgi:hypothetical protein